MKKEVKYVEYVEAVDNEGFVVSKWTAFVKEDGRVLKETKSFDWTKVLEETDVTTEQFRRLVSVR